MVILYDITEMDQNTKYFMTSGHFGKRLFRWDKRKKEVLQIVVDPGNKIRGSRSMIGIYYVTENTLQGNYLWDIKNSKNSNIKVTTEKLFDFYFNQVFESLKKTKK